MKIPTKIKVGAIDYDIIIVEDMEQTGVTSFPKQEIKIHKGKEDIMNVTFLHELLHTINNEYKETEIEFSFLLA